VSGSGGPGAPGARGDLRLYARLLWDARRYWPHLGLNFLVELAAMPLALLTPLALAIVLDTVVGSAPPPAFLQDLAPGGSVSADMVLVFAAVLFVAVSALTQLQVLCSTLLSTFIGERLTLEFRTRLFAQMQRLSFSYHDTAGTSDALYRIQYDAPAIDWVAVHGFTPFITAGATLVAMIYVTARIDTQLAAIALAITPALVILALSSRRAVRRRWDRFKSLESSSFSVVHEVLGNLRVVKGFGQEEREEGRFSDASRTTLSARLKVSTAEGLLEFLATLTTAIGTALVLLIGAMNVRSGSMSAGDLVLVMGYMTQLYAPLKTMAQSVTTLQASLASAERAYAVLDRARDVHDLPGARPLERARGEIVFEGVSFGYQPGKPVLSDATLAVPLGTRVGIQGMTGSGKTTVVNLLMRFYDPTAGRIVLDGLDARAYRLEDLRNQFALVLQEPLLFSRTIAENIAYARPDATDEEIQAAASMANADGFIRHLPDGYETIVGERGMTLSGGERQRISLARAFLKDAPILILDEPTSSLDERTEAQIIEALERLMAGRTTFMIAHRLSTLASCDLRVEIRDGRFVAVDASATSAPALSAPHLPDPEPQPSFPGVVRQPGVAGAGG
jgi:ATP-binding cassette subfamily B protein